MRFVNTLPLIFGLTAALGSSMALALPSDREQPIRVQADSAELTTSRASRSTAATSW